MGLAFHEIQYGFLGGSRETANESPFMEYIRYKNLVTIGVP